MRYDITVHTGDIAIRHFPSFSFLVTNGAKAKPRFILMIFIKLFKNWFDSRMEITFG